MPGSIVRVNPNDRSWHRIAEGEAVLPTILSVRDGDDTDLVAAGTLKEKGRKASVQALVGADTEITVEIAGTNAAGGTARWAVRAKNPKGHPVTLPELVTGTPGD